MNKLCINLIWAFHSNHNLSFICSTEPISTDKRITFRFCLFILLPRDGRHHFITSVELVMWLRVYTCSVISSDRAWKIWRVVPVKNDLLVASVRVISTSRKHSSATIAVTCKRNMHVRAVSTSSIRRNHSSLIVMTRPIVMQPRPSPKRVSIESESRRIWRTSWRDWHVNFNCKLRRGTFGYVDGHHSLHDQTIVIFSIFLWFCCCKCVYRCHRTVHAQVNPAMAMRMPTLIRLEVCAKDGESIVQSVKFHWTVWGRHKHISVSIMALDCIRVKRATATEFSFTKSTRKTIRMRITIQIADHRNEVHSRSNPVSQRFVRVFEVFVRNWPKSNYNYSAPHFQRIKTEPETHAATSTQTEPVSIGAASVSIKLEPMVRHMRAVSGNTADEVDEFMDLTGTTDDDDDEEGSEIDWIPYLGDDQV